MRSLFLGILFILPMTAFAASEDLGAEIYSIGNFKWAAPVPGVSLTGSRLDNLVLIADPGQEFIDKCTAWIDIGDLPSLSSIERAAEDATSRRLRIIDTDDTRQGGCVIQSISLP